MDFPHPLRSIFVAIFLAFQSCVLASVSAQPNNSSRSPGVNRGDSAGQLSPTLSVETVVIPGPLRSFLRMAGISQKTSLDEIMPMLAHSLSLQGYSAGKETEFLRLLDRYVHLAREVRILFRRERHDPYCRLRGCDSAHRSSRLQVQGDMRTA